jgi:hypothetical protein
MKPEAIRQNVKGYNLIKKITIAMIVSVDHMGYTI